MDKEGAMLLVRHRYFYFVPAFLLAIFTLLRAAFFGFFNWNHYWGYYAHKLGTKTCTQVVHFSQVDIRNSSRLTDTGTSEN